jgi:beta-glucanase (GH16 family)
MQVLSRWRLFKVNSLVSALCLIMVLGMIKKSAIAPILSRSFHLTPLYLALSFMATRPAGTAMQVAVLTSSDPVIVAPPGAEISIQANFDARWALPEDDSLVLFLVGTRGIEAARVENDLDNRFTILPTSRWVGPITVLSSMTIPRLADGVYSIMLGLYRPTGPVQLTPGPGVTQDAHFRYIIGTVRVDASAPPPGSFLSPTLDLTGYHLTFNESFTDMSISDSTTNDGARWYARNEECCMATTDGTATAMVGISSPQNPFSLIAGGGLNIRLQRLSNSWTSGVITSVDSLGRGFSQQFGYFEIKARFPSGEDTWPAFWLLNTASKSGHAPQGEIDVVEYIANPRLPNYIATTLHDWSNKTAPAASHYRVPLPTTGFHTYGMMWTATTMTFYFDGAVSMRCPTPSIMKEPYYLLVDLGIGSGWPTERTPPTNDMQIKYIHVYSK